MMIQDNTCALPQGNYATRRRTRSAAGEWMACGPRPCRPTSSNQDGMSARCAKNDKYAKSAWGRIKYVKRNTWHGEGAEHQQEDWFLASRSLPDCLTRNETHSELLSTFRAIWCNLISSFRVDGWSIYNGWEVKEGKEGRTDDEDDNDNDNDGWCGSIIVRGVRDMVA